MIGIILILLFMSNFLVSFYSGKPNYKFLFISVIAAILIIQTSK